MKYRYRSFIIANLITLCLAGIASADAQTDCREAARPLEQTDQISFSGEMLTEGDWSVPFSTITIDFANNPPLVWSPRTVTRKLALMDWIDTALKQQEISGYPPFAARDTSGNIWLVSPYTLKGDNTGCLSHPLDRITPIITTPEVIIEHAFEIQIEEVP